MNIFLGAVKKTTFYDVYFYHKRKDDTEYEVVEATSEKEAIQIATKQHRKTYAGSHIELFKVVEYLPNKKTKTTYF